MVAIPPAQWALGPGWGLYRHPTAPGGRNATINYRAMGERQGWAQTACT